MRNEEPEKQLLLVNVGPECNNNCIMCSVRGESDLKDESKEKIFKVLKKGKKEGYKKVEFTGGEPTIREDITSLVSKAKELGYCEVGLSTNGRLFRYEKFCNQMLKNGLSNVTLTLYGPKEEIHDKIAATPDAFSQSLRGLRNILNSTLGVSVNTVVLKPNYKILKEMGIFLASEGVRDWSLVDLLPQQRGKERYSFLSVEGSKLAQEFERLRPTLDRYRQVSFFDFPYCFFSPNIFNLSNTSFVTARGKSELVKQISPFRDRFRVTEESKEAYYSDAYKKRIEVCSRCKFRKDCGGVWKSYLDLYGAESIRKLASSHNCLT